MPPKGVDVFAVGRGGALARAALFGLAHRRSLERPQAARRGPLVPRHHGRGTKGDTRRLL